MSFDQRASRTLGSLRVLHVLPLLCGSGSERQVVELLAGMRAAGIATGLLTLDDYDVPESRALPLVRLAAQMRSFRPHIVHTHSKFGRYWGRTAALLARVPYIVHTEHDPCDPRRTNGERMLDTLLNAMTARVVTFFEEQAAYLQASAGWPRDKCVLIPSGVAPPIVSGNTKDAARAAFKLPRDRFVILSAGPMEYEKNHTLALDALAALRSDLRARTLLCFTGTGNDEWSLRESARRLDIAEYIRFLGYREELRHMLPAADLLLITSHFEGMPVAMLDAMHAGIPILSTPWIGVRSMLGDGRDGFIARSFEAPDMVRALERAIAHPAARWTVSRNASQSVRESYCIDRTIDAHVDLYRNLCAAMAA